MEYKTYPSFDGFEKEKFGELVVSGFKKKLVPDYFSYAKPTYICVADNGLKYCGAIIVEDIENGLCYLDKIVVGPDYQGNGICKKMWSMLSDHSHKFVWRAKPDNKVKDFYMKECTGIQKVNDWIIYWKGLDPNGHDLCTGVKFAIGKKVTLEDI